MSCPFRQTSRQARRLSREFDSRLPADPGRCFCHFLIFCWNWWVWNVPETHEAHSCQCTVFLSTGSTSTPGSTALAGTPVSLIQKLWIKNNQRKGQDHFEWKWGEWSGSNMQGLFSYNQDVAWRNNCKCEEWHSGALLSMHRFFRITWRVLRIRFSVWYQRL